MIYKLVFSNKVVLVNVCYQIYNKGILSKHAN